MGLAPSLAGCFIENWFEMDWGYQSYGTSVGSHFISTSPDRWLGVRAGDLCTATAVWRIVSKVLEDWAPHHRPAEDKHHGSFFYGGNSRLDYWGSISLFFLASFKICFLTKDPVSIFFLDLIWEKYSDLERHGWSMGSPMKRMNHNPNQKPSEFITNCFIPIHTQPSILINRFIHDNNIIPIFGA